VNKKLFYKIRLFKIGVNYLDFEVLYFGFLFAGYFIGIFLGRTAKSISFPLFLTLVFLTIALFKITKAIFLINQFQARINEEYLGSISANIFILFVVFLLGFMVAYLFCMRIMNMNLNKILKIILTIPIINILVLFLRLPKDAKLRFYMNKYNASTLITIILVYFYVQPLLDQSAIDQEKKYYEKTSNDKSNQIVQMIKENKSLPYEFDPDGYLKVFKLESFGNTIEFSIIETELNIFDWNSHELNTWLSSELCRQQTKINDKLSENISIFFSFKVYDFKKIVRWDEISDASSC
jgi:hypothetical protein